MELKDVAELQVLLEGVALPAEREELLGYAASQGATPNQMGMLSRLPDQEFETIDEAAEKLIRVQPEAEDEEPKPREESGDPPGGEAYTQKRPESGSVRTD